MCLLPGKEQGDWMGFVGSKVASLVNAAGAGATIRKPQPLSLTAISLNEME